jgi:transposase
MELSDFYFEMLGIKSPWFVKESIYNAKKNRIDVYLEHEEKGVFHCSFCKKSAPIYDHSKERTWRHLDTCDVQTYVHAKLPRIDCPEHFVQQVEISWAKDFSRFTKQMYRYILKIIFNVEVFSRACVICKIGWNTCFSIMETYLEEEIKSNKKIYPINMGIDEKAILKGHKYMTVITDLDTGEVVDVFENRTKEAVLDYFNSIPMKYRKKIKCLSMDMWPAYYEAAIETIPGAKNKIVHDKFHVMDYLNKGVNNVRIEEHRELTIQKDDSLKRSKFLWLYNPENMPEKRKDEFEVLKDLNLKTSVAWGFKETFRNIYNYNIKGWAHRFFNNWYTCVEESAIKPMLKVADMIKRHIDNIVTYCDFKVSNGKAEAVNSKIMALKRRARGHRNFQNLRTSILFFFGQNRYDPCK